MNSSNFLVIVNFRIHEMLVQAPLLRPVVPVRPMVFKASDIIAQI